VSNLHIYRIVCDSEQLGTRGNRRTTNARFSLEVFTILKLKYLSGSRENLPIGRLLFFKLLSC